MLFNKIFWLVIFVPFIAGAIRYRKLTLSHRFLFFYILVGVLTELSTRGQKLITDVQNNMVWGHLYISVSFIFISLFYLVELRRFINKKIIIAVIVLFELFSILNVMFIQSYYDYPSATGAIGASILVVFAILLFSRIMIEGKIKVLSQSSLIWINTAVLLYYAGNFFFHILYNLFLELPVEYILRTLLFFKILTILLYTSLGIGLWKAGKKHSLT